MRSFLFKFYSQISKNFLGFKLFLAEQKAAAEKKRQQELRDQYEREQEVFSNK